MIIKVGVIPPLDISIINTAYVLKVRRKRERIPILRAIQFD